MTTQRVPVFLGALSLMFVAACGDDDDAASTEAAAAETSAVETTAGGTGTDAPAQGEAQIVISGSSFGDPITVPAGATVTVRNDDSRTHTWTSDDGVWDSGNLAQGDTFSFTFEEPGDYSFHCERHASMTGSITVT